MAQLSQIFGKAAKALDVPVLTPEYEIVIALVDSYELTADQLFERSSLSRAGFFNTVERLKARGIILSDPSPHDRRCRIYRLSGDLRRFMLERLGMYRDDYMRFRRDAFAFPGFVSRDLTERRRRGIDYFTCEFKILFYLYLRPILPNHALRALVDASDTKFHCSLRDLLNQGLVTVAPGLTDRRLKQYQINCLGRLTMDKLHRDVFAWLERSAPELEHPTSPNIPQALVSAIAPGSHTPQD